MGPGKRRVAYHSAREVLGAAIRRWTQHTPGIELEHNRVTEFTSVRDA